MVNPGGRDEGFADDVARWLEGAMRKQRGSTPMTDSDLIKKSGVGRSTLYRLLRGESVADEATLARLSRALGVATPRIVRTLQFDEPPPRLSPLDELLQAQASLDRAIERFKKR